MVGYGISVTKAVKGLPVVGGFMSRIFKKPQTTDGFEKFCNFYGPQLATEKWLYTFYIDKFINRQSMTAQQKNKCTKAVLNWTRNWTKAQKKNLQDACANIQVISAPPPPEPPEVHTLSASYNPQQITKSRDVQEVVQAGISKIPIYVLVGIGALLIIPQLLKMRGGKE